MVRRSWDRPIKLIDEVASHESVWKCLRLPKMYVCSSDWFSTTGTTKTPEKVWACRVFIAGVWCSNPQHFVYVVQQQVRSCLLPFTVGAFCPDNRGSHKNFPLKTHLQQTHDGDTGTSSKPAWCHSVIWRAQPVAFCNNISHRCRLISTVFIVALKYSWVPGQNLAASLWQGLGRLMPFCMSIWFSLDVCCCWETLKGQECSLCSVIILPSLRGHTEMHQTFGSSNWTVINRLKLDERDWNWRRHSSFLWIP